MNQSVKHRIAQRLDELKKTTETELGWVKGMLKRARTYTETIMETVRVPLVVLNEDLHVVSANRSFYQTFQVPPEETEGRLIYELDDHQWDNPWLRVLLEERLPCDNHVWDFEVDHEFPTVGHRTMLLNAHRINRNDYSRPIILLALEDITELRQAEEAIRQLATLQASRDHLEGEVTRLQGAEEAQRQAREAAGKQIEQLNADRQAAKDHLEREVKRFQEVEDTHRQAREAAGRQIEQLNADLHATKGELQQESTKRQEAEESLRALEELTESVAQTIQDNLLAVSREMQHLLESRHGGDSRLSGSNSDREESPEPECVTPSPSPEFG
ncbi:MAG: PAS domain-containing protein [Dehalococcoidia bacterium]